MSLMQQINSIYLAIINCNSLFRLNMQMNHLNESCIYNLYLNLKTMASTLLTVFIQLNISMKIACVNQNEKFKTFRSTNGSRRVHRRIYFAVTPLRPVCCRVIL